MRKIYLSLLAIIFCALSGFGQVSVYTFTQTSAAYTPITGGTLLGTATANTLAGSLDDQVFNLPAGSFPFTFTFNGIGYTGCNVSTNGYITFGATAPVATDDQAISLNTAYAGVIAPWARDINGIFALGAPPRTSNIRWETVGVAPNREVVIQWQDFRPAFSTSTTLVYVFSFQVRLSETSNRASIVYSAGEYLVGSASIAGATTTAAPQVGLRGATNTDFNNRTNSNAVSFTASTAGAVNNANQFFNTTTNPPGMPSAGLTYTFAPATCFRPTGVTVSAITLNSATLNWTAASPAPSAGYEWEVRTSGAPGSGPVGLVASGTTGPGVTTTPVSGLVPNTAYSAYVRSVCVPITDLSAWTVATTFNTLSCSPIITQTPAAICPGQIQTITAASAGTSQTFSSGAINLAIPDNTPAGVTTPPIVIPAAVNMASPGSLKVRINASHTWVGDLIFRLNSPCGTSFLFDRPGVVPVLGAGNLDNLGTSNISPNPPPAVYIFDVSAATVIPETAAPSGFIAAGSYKPSDVAGNSHNWAGITFPCTATGNWTLTISDNAGADLGTLVDWAIIQSTSVPVAVTFSPVTGLFLNSNGTGPYAGTPVSTIYASPASTTIYTATDAACPTGPVNFTVTVNAATIITAHPSNSAVLCNGGSTTFTAGATGAGTLTYQWQVSTNSGGTWTNLTNTPPYSGALTNTLTVNPVTPVLNGNQYRVIVTGTCGPATSNPAQLTVDQLTHSSYSITPVGLICSPGSVTISATAANGILSGGSAVVGTSGTINQAIPDNTPAGVNSAITLSPITFATPADMKVRITASHTWVGDLVFTLTSPCGVTFLFSRLGVPPLAAGNQDNLGTSNVSPNPPAATYTFDVAGATVMPEVSVAAGFIPGGIYRPSDVAGVAHNWAGLAFPCTAGGTWTLNVSDNAGADLGTLVSWQILGPPTTNYTHSLSGPGTITQNAPTGVNNATGNFSITGIPAGNHSYIVTSTDPFGCSVSTTISNIVINQTPVVTITPATPSVCAGSLVQLNGGATPSTGIGASFTSTGAITVPAPPSTGAATGAPANPYPVALVVSGVPAGATVKSVTLNTVAHSFPSDMDIVLQSPTGTNVVIMSDAGDGTDATGQTYVFDDAAAALMATVGLNPSGTYKPTNIGAADNYAAPLPLTITQATPTLATFGSGNMNGTWNLFVVDDAGVDIGTIASFTITFTQPSPVIFSPLTNIYTNAAGTIPYTGTPVNTVYVSPATNTVYTATSTIAGCTSSANVTVTVIPLPVITVQPTPATQTLCPGFTATYSVTATGTGLSYQWKRNGVNLVDNAQTFGSNTNTLTITNVSTANSGTYTVEITGTCIPPALVSNPVVLNVATAPLISAQPASRTNCEGTAASFTVATAGSLPPPTIYQWQVSTDAGATWTNLTTGGSFTPTFTIPAVTIAMNNNRYRVIVTNTCGQTITSAAATLTVNARPVVTAAPLPSRICLSDTLVPLVGSPVGGTWSGIGVFGSNFIPNATAVGTYTLTYTFTNAATCTATATVVAKVEDCQERLRLLRDDAVILYPNPNNGRFNIRINSTLYNYLAMKVYNIQGQLVNGKIVNDVLISPAWGGLVYGRIIPIDLTHLPAGIYMVEFYYDDGVRTSEKTFKVVISGH